jgi:hypothetical protein
MCIGTTLPAYRVRWQLPSTEWSGDGEYESGVVPDSVTWNAATRGRRRDPVTHPSPISSGGRQQARPLPLSAEMRAPRLAPSPLPHNDSQQPAGRLVRCCSVVDATATRDTVRLRRLGAEALTRSRLGRPAFHPRGASALVGRKTPNARIAENASVRVLAARVLAIGSKQKSAALRAGYSNVAQAATSSRLPLPRSARVKQKCARAPSALPTWPVVRGCRSRHVASSGSRCS